MTKQIIPLKPELALKEEQLSHYQKKAAGWKGTTIKNKKIAAARFHATGEESSISSSDMKKYECGSILGDLHNGGKLFLQTLIHLMGTLLLMSVYFSKLFKEIIKCLRLKF